MDAWHETTAHGFPDRVASALSALCDSGLRMRPPRTGGHAGDGLLTFAAVDDTTIEALRHITHTSRNRVIALQVAGAPLKPQDYQRLIQAGADEILSWLAPAQHTAACVVARMLRWKEVDVIVDSDLVRGTLVGQSAVWRATLRRIVEIACFTDAPVLITGESGTGKELVARLIHALDRRAGKRNLVVVDCTTLQSELMGSELFGHERGAFTNALASREGACQLADKGTLFLDEIGEISPTLQPQLLRVLQERSFKPVGANHWNTAQFRLICATNRSFDDEIKIGRFRADLYYRIADCIVSLPSLRERSEDTLPLAEHLLNEMSGGRRLTLSEPVREFLLRRQFPGNVRELRRLLSRVCSRHSGNGLITVGDIPEDEWRIGAAACCDWRDAHLDHAIHRAIQLGAPLKELTQYATTTAIRHVLAQEMGNLQRAAVRLGMSDRALQLRRAQERGASAFGALPGEA